MQIELLFETYSCTVMYVHLSTKNFWSFKAVYQSVPFLLSPGEFNYPYKNLMTGGPGKGNSEFNISLEPLHDKWPSRMVGTQIPTSYLPSH